MLTLILLVLSAFAAVLPMVGMLLLIWWLDRYDREPLWLVLMTFFWGALVATASSLFGNTLTHFILEFAVGAERASLITPVAVAPLVEEPTKALVLLLLIRSRQFDNATDGFVYGAASGLGFGMTENFMYFSTAAQMASADPWNGIVAWAGTVVARTAFSAVMHATASSLVGASVGFARYRGWPALLTLPFLGLGAAMGMHALWNGLLTFDGMVASPVSLTTLNFALLPVQVLLAFLTFQLCLLGDRWTIRDELRQEAAEHGTLPAEHAELLSSVLRRSWSGRIHPRVDRKAYIRATTTLAFRRWQLPRASGERRMLIERDLDRLRREVRGLLESATGR
jgi:RsiW-degrading membrane proteinase PrsW (M82 family)